MIGYRGPGFAFERDDFAGPDNTRYRHDRVAAHAMEVIVMSGDRLQSRSPVVEEDLAKHSAGNQLFRRTEH